MKILLIAAAAVVFATAAAAQAPAVKPAGLNADSQQQTLERRKKRVKGGSGCDSANDVREHAECR